MQIDRESVQILNDISNFYKEIFNGENDEKNEKGDNIDNEDLLKKIIIDPNLNEYTIIILREFTYVINFLNEVSEFLDLKDIKKFPLKSEIKEMKEDILEEPDDSQVVREDDLDDDTKSKISDDTPKQDNSETKETKSHTTEKVEDEKNSETLQESDSLTKTKLNTKDLDTEDEELELPKSSKYNSIEVESSNDKDSNKSENDSENVMFGDEAFEDQSGKSGKSVTKSSQKEEHNVVSEHNSQKSSKKSSHKQSENVSHKSENKVEDSKENKTDNTSVPVDDEETIERDEEHQSDSKDKESLTEKEELMEEKLAQDIVNDEKSELEREYENDVEEQNKTLSIPHGHDFDSKQTNMSILPDNHIENQEMNKNPYEEGIQNDQYKSDYSIQSDQNQLSSESFQGEDLSNDSLSEMTQKLQNNNHLDIDHVISLPIIDSYQSKKVPSNGVYSKAFTNIEQGIKQSGNEGIMERNYLIQRYGPAKAQVIAAQMQQKDNQRYHRKRTIPVVDMSQASSSFSSSSCSDLKVDHHPEGINAQAMMNLGNIQQQKDEDLDYLLNNIESHSIGSFQNRTMGTGQAILMKPGIINKTISQGSYASGQRVPLHARFKAHVKIPVISVKSVKQMMAIDSGQPLYSHSIYHAPQTPQVKYPCPPQNLYTQTTPITSTYSQPIQIYRKTPQYVSESLYPINNQINPLQINQQTFPPISEIENDEQYEMEDPRDEYLNSQNSMIDSMLSGSMMKKERRLSLKKNKKVKKKKHIIKNENLRSKIRTDGKMSLAQRRRTLSRIKKKHSYEHLYRGNHKKNNTLKNKIKTCLLYTSPSPRD